MLTYQETPIQEINDPSLSDFGVRLFVKREDLNHPFVSGNKWWKLKYNLEEALRLKKKTLLTFGGAYSNHIYATAAAARELEFNSIGVIRGEETLPLNKTLSFAKAQGMQLYYVDRESYRKKGEVSFIHELQSKFGDFYMIPEGGTNELAVKGAQEFAQKLNEQFDYVCCAAGTGGTVAGFINALNSQATVLGFSVLKGEFLKAEVRRWLKPIVDFRKWDIITEYHFGGYAKYDSRLLEFINYQQRINNLALEHVYTAKCLFGICDMIKKGYFANESRILFVHTGGLQGKLEY